MANEIDERHVLPCDFMIGSVRFRKGVALETVRIAAQRWFDEAKASFLSGKDVGKAIGWDAAKRDTSHLLQLDGRRHSDRDGCDPPEWHGPTGE